MSNAATDTWAITLTPHRSLTREGFIAIMVLVAATNLVAGMAFYLLGAWPVVGFLGLDVALIWWAFRKNFCDAARAERIAVSGGTVVLSRIAGDGTKQDTTFNRRWVKVELEYDAFRELVGKLYLRSHGQRHEIASFLGAEERQALAQALRAHL